MIRPTYIYFIKPVGMDGPIKIGCSATTDQRLCDLAMWSPFPLEVMGKTPGTLKDEGFLHRCFSEYHSHHEWFYFTPALGETIKKILASSLDEVRGSLTPKKSIRRGRQKRAERTENQKLEASFASRIGAVQRRLRKDNEKGIWYAPADVRQIMRRWHGWPYRKTAGVPPTNVELARLEEYLAAPLVHSVNFWLAHRRDSICIPVFELENAA